MERNKKMSKAKLIELITFLIFIGFFIYFGISVINDYEDRITRRDQTIDSLQNENIKTYNFYSKKLDSIVTIDKKYSYVRGNKEVSIASIVKSANVWFNERERFKLERDAYKADLINANKDYNLLHEQYNQLVKNYNEAISKANSNIKGLNSTIDKYHPYKYQELDAFRSQIAKYYGIEYKVTKNVDSTVTIHLIGNSKIDTALSIYENLKHDKNFRIDKKKKTID
ncbi:hypothetical protein [Pedobacter mendelii]|uniref:Uncharacterized protein n=1 Tax=Pedobacter mendelii TaxID=1908240 RepID=A0ABQ2BGJ1_9SPHI|nr:hypothetical protein [Pedobacter mendelii]GGI23651.1 hypothetical protein GCM10008119_08710 [Pedobacter mendelii]